jgi:hypothetical protein
MASTTVESSAPQQIQATTSSTRVLRNTPLQGLLEMFGMSGASGGDSRAAQFPVGGNVVDGNGLLFLGLSLLPLLF